MALTNAPRCLQIFFSLCSDKVDFVFIVVNRLRDQAWTWLQYYFRAVPYFETKSGKI